jgi:hypothetical protein
MGPHCEHCPVEEVAWCIGLCAWAASGDPARLAHIVHRSASGPSGPPPEGPSPAAIPTVFPLAGDLVAVAMKRLGADRFAQWFAEQVGWEDCGCEERRRRLNEADRKLRRWLGLTAPPASPVGPPNKAD